MRKKFWFGKPRTTKATKLKHYMTVGDLRKAIEDLPDEGGVFYQRIEDVYFMPGKGWQENSVFKPDSMHPEFDDQYIQAWCAVKYKDEPNLFITAHY